MKTTMLKFGTILILLIFSRVAKAQLSGTFDACDPGPTFYPWYIGGNFMVPTLPANPPPHWTPAPIDIGTCSPEDFILKANNRQSVFIKGTGYIGINEPSPNAALDVKAPSGSGTQTNFRIYGDANGNLESTTGMRFNFASGKDVLFNEGTATSNITRMTIKHGGQICIGNSLDVSSPYVNTALFTVKGLAVAKEIVVTQLSWSDFVFDKNYKLMPLNELETFYQNNHHLPEVPSAGDIAANGNDLGKTDAVLLQKIEELTLYIVELEKRLKKVEGQ